MLGLKVIMIVKGPLELPVLVDDFGNIRLKYNGVDFELFEVEEIPRQVFEKGPEIESPSVTNDFDTLLSELRMPQE